MIECGIGQWSAYFCKSFTYMNNYRNRKMEVLCNKAFLYVVSHRCNARTTIKIFLFLLHKGKHNVVGKVASLNCGKKIHFLRKCEVLGPFLEWASQIFPTFFVLKPISVLMLTSQKLNICKNLRQMFTCTQTPYFETF